MTRATATRDLNELVGMQALVKIGDLRHARYQINLSNWK
jgi:Fic family protein